MRAVARQPATMRLEASVTEMGLVSATRSESVLAIRKSLALLKAGGPFPPLPRCSIILLSIEHTGPPEVRSFLYIVKGIPSGPAQESLVLITASSTSARVGSGGSRCCGTFLR